MRMRGQANFVNKYILANRLFIHAHDDLYVKETRLYMENATLATILSFLIQMIDQIKMKIKRLTVYFLMSKLYVFNNKNVAMKIKCIQNENLFLRSTKITILIRKWIFVYYCFLK